MSELRSSSARAIQDVLAAKDVELKVVELPQSTRTAAEAAAAIGCAVGQIAKSLVFRGANTNEPVLIIDSGTNRVDESKIAALLSEPIEKVDAAFVRQHTGFVIGGVPPVGHRKILRTFVDQDLLRYDTIWAAAGTPNAVFRLTPADLIAITNGEIAKIN